MPFTLDRIEKNKAVLSIEVPEDQVRAAVERAARRLANRVSIPGFRRGKAPRGVLERHLGREALLNEALKALIPPSYSQAVAESGIDPIGYPETEVEQLEEGKPLKYRATVELRPEVDLGDYASARESVPRQKVEVTEEELDRELEALRDRQGRLLPEESGAVANGHWAVIDLEGKVGERAYPERKLEGLLVEVGAGRLPPGVEEGMAGMAPGQTREIKVLLPPDYPGEGLAGQEAVFTVTLRELKRRELPALDDAFAASLGFGTVKELREDLKNKLTALKERAERRRFRAAVVDKVVEGASVDLPDSLVERAVQRLWARWLEELKGRGLTLERYLQLSGRSEESVKSEFREQAAAGVKRTLVLDAVASKEKIRVSPEELQVQAARVVQAYGDSDWARRALERPETLERLQQDLEEHKTVVFLAEGRVPDLSRVEAAGDEGPAAEIAATSAPGGGESEAPAAAAPEGEGAGAAPQGKPEEGENA
ncbi:MAG: trigger factor [Acetobacteraceae bacterium]|nr:trigger factor [Acetobacteraceae bacterium]